MRRQAPMIEWQIVEDDATWARLCALDRASVTPVRQSTRQLLWTVVVLLLLLVSASGWWRSRTQVRPHQTKAKLRATGAYQLSSAERNDDSATLYWQYHFAQQELALPTRALRIDSTVRLDIELQAVEVLGDPVIVTSIPNEYHR